MAIYERGIRNIESASDEELRLWIEQRMSGEYMTNLDSMYTAARMETSELVRELYKNLRSSEKEKVERVLRELLVDAIQERQAPFVEETVVMMAQIGEKFPEDVLLKFLETEKDSSFHDAKSAIVAWLQSKTSESEVVAAQFSDWFYQDPLPIGNEHALQLFAGLVSLYPEMYPELMERLLSINEALGEAHKFQYRWILATIINNCPEDVLKDRSSFLPDSARRDLLDLNEFLKEE